MATERKVNVGALAVNLPGGAVRYYTFGETIDLDDLDDAQRERFEELGVFAEVDADAEQAPEPAPVAQFKDATLDVVDDDDLIEWVSHNSVTFILAQAEEHKDRIEAIFEAEHASAGVSGTEPRKTLIEGLDKLA